MDYCLEYELLNDENHVFKNISYDELMDFFEGFKTGLIMIGGYWCKNCQAIIDLLNNVAKKSGIDYVYNYDPKFINVYGEEEDLRDCKSLEVKLKYYKIIENLGYKSDKLVVDTLIPRISVPFIFAIKNGTCVGYYEEELLRDGVLLYKEGHTEDYTLDFVHEITKLIEKINQKDRLM